VFLGVNLLTRRRKMIKKEIAYFERSGVENTEDVIEIVYQRLQEGDIRSVVVASSRGTTGLKFAKRMAKDTNLVIVSSHPGRSKPGLWDFDLDTLRELETMGCKVIKQTHAMSGMERSFSQKFSGASHSELLAECLKSLFGPGMKVAIECAVMAADGGAIPIEKTISVGGTSAHGSGADYAIVCFPSHASNFFDFRVLEILAKPFRRD
jgi:hypothetical protein